MILVLTGTQDRPFARLLRMVDEAKLAGSISEEVHAQCGHTTFQPMSQDYSVEPFIEESAYNELLSRADLVITHGGIASIADGLRAHKVIIAVPRLKRYREHQNDHQLEIVEKYAKAGYLLSCLDGEEFPAVLEQARHFTPEPFQHDPLAVVALVRDFIEEHSGGGAR